MSGESLNRLNNGYTVKTAVGILYTVKGVESELGVDSSRILELCEAGIMPHLRLDGFHGFLFHGQEIRKWIKTNLVKRIAGQSVPSVSTQIVKREKNKSIGCPPALIPVPDLVELDPSIVTGVYFLCYRGEVVYVGQSTNIPNRCKTHRQEGEKRFDRVFFLRVPESALLSVEEQYIAGLQPKYNQTHEQA